MPNSSQPEERARDQKVGHLGAPIVVNEGLPIRRRAAAGVGMLVEMRSVEERKAVRIGGEVPGHPIQDDAEIEFVRAVDEGAEVVRRAEAARGRKHSRRLIAPRGVVWVLGDRQHFHVREAKVAHVRQ